MKCLEIPRAIEWTGTDKDGNPKKVTLTFKEWLQAGVDQNAQLATGVKQMWKSIKLTKKIEDANGKLELEDAEWELLKECVEAAKYNPAVVKHLGPFLEAFEGVQEVKK